MTASSEFADYILGKFSPLDDVIGSSLDTIVWKAIKDDWYIELSKT